MALTSSVLRWALHDVAERRAVETSSPPSRTCPRPGPKEVANLVSDDACGRRTLALQSETFSVASSFFTSRSAKGCFELTMMSASRISPESGFEYSSVNARSFRVGRR